MKKDLIVYIAHIDDFECACYGYVLNHYKDYDKVKIITATTWPAKRPVWEANKKEFPLDLQNKLIDINLEFEARTLWNNLDSMKDAFYKLMDFNKRFDLISHDQNDCHTDHTACFNVAKGMYKYCNRFITIYSPSSAHFHPNFFIGLNSEQYEIKKKGLDKYDIQKEQSYTKLGYYLQSEEHYNIGRAHVLENYVFDDYEHYECYKILKWL
jgi:LmbE family N-acetylglucosaminyl deacetylase